MGTEVDSWWTGGAGTALGACRGWARTAVDTWASDCTCLCTSGTTRSGTRTPRTSLPGAKWTGSVGTALGARRLGARTACCTRQVTVRVWVPVVPQAPEQELQGPVCQVPNGAHAALVQLWELAGGEPEQPAALGQVTVRYCVPLVPQAPEQEPQGPVCQVPSGQGSL